ncbi:MAG: S41 family peptidase [Bacteroidota bacterium]|nr:S41 family peptidase [Bacteroidota bacterium]
MRFFKTLILISIFLSFSAITFSQEKINTPSSESSSSISNATSNHFEISKNLDIYVSLLKELNTYYVDGIDPSALVKASIKAMLKSLDPYTVYYSESDAEDFRFLTTGSYGGIGSMISNTGDYVIFSEPYKGFPASKAGILAGDIILEIDGKDAKGLSNDEISELLKGQPGTEVNVLIKRPFLEKEIIKILTREKIKIENVPYSGMLSNNVGYISLAGFKRDAGADVKNAFNKLLKENKQMSGLILDLRGNPGGLLIESVRIAALFVDKGELIVSTKGKVDAWNKTYKTHNAPVSKDIPLVVLINGRSASASEIVAGSLQDLDRAIIIGERSFGKGLVQTQRSLSYNTHLKVTTAKYYIPSGRCIQELDYSHKDEKGKAKKVPDSLVTKYQTRNGRAVIDAKGISPDIEVESEKYPEIIKTLIIERVIFDFATKYRHSHDSIDLPKNFTLSEKEYQEFVDFAKDKEIKYKTSTEKSLKKLKKNAKKEKYFDLISNEYELIIEKLEEHKSDELNHYKNRIKALVENEIVGRYYFQEGKIINRLETDKKIAEALKLFSDLDKYNSILNPEK